MKTNLTKKQILKISRDNGMSFDFRMSKSGMMLWVNSALSGLNDKTQFAMAVVEADAQLKIEKREIKLKKLGL